MEIYEYVGKKIKVSFLDGTKPIIGKCVCYTSALDNEPEKESIYVSGENGGLYELFEDEIKEIEIL